MKNYHQPTSNHHGFTLIEIAIVMVIIGLLTGGGVSLMGVLTKRKARNETIQYLQQAQAALISFACIHGKLPWADTNGNGNENANATSGALPYITLKLKPKDPYQRSLKYAVNSNLGTDKPTSCNALKTGLSGGPLVVDADGSSISFPVAAILISAGPMDADGDGDVFDDVAGSHQGDNTDGNPSYIRHPPIDTFDDLVVYIGENELYGSICEYLTLAINNNGPSTVYAYDSIQGIDLPGGGINSGSTKTFEIISGTRIEIWSAAGGVGTIVVSSPKTPISLAGKGTTLNIP